MRSFVLLFGLWFDIFESILIDFTAERCPIETLDENRGFQSLSIYLTSHLQLNFGMGMVKCVSFYLFYYYSIQIDEIFLDNVNELIWSFRKNRL